MDYCFFSLYKANGKKKRCTLLNTSLKIVDRLIS